MKPADPEAPAKHICDTCGAEFDTQEELVRHVEGAHGEEEGSGRG